MWDTIWNIAESEYFPTHMKQVVDLTSWQSFSYQAEVIKASGLQCEAISKQENIGTLLALVAATWTACVSAGSSSTWSK